MQIIQIVISPNGDTRVSTHGYRGSQCKEASRELEQALGLVVSDLPTVDMYSDISPTVQQEEGP